MKCKFLRVYVHAVVLCAWSILVVSSAAARDPFVETTVLPRKADGNGEVAVSGELRQWHKVTITLDGPFAHERDNQPNPFTDIAFNVTFTVRWFNPRRGGALVRGSTDSVTAGGRVDLGFPPSDPNEDWLAVIRP